MTSIIRVGQSKFVTVQIDEDSNERIMNCIQTLSELQEAPVVHEMFLEDTKLAYSKMIAAQEVRFFTFRSRSVVSDCVITGAEKGRGEERSRELQGC